MTFYKFSKKNWLLSQSLTHSQGDLYYPLVADKNLFCFPTMNSPAIITAITNSATVSTDINNIKYDRKQGKVIKAKQVQSTYSWHKSANAFLCEFERALKCFFLNVKKNSELWLF